MLLLLMLVLQLAPQHRSRERTHDAMPTHLIATKVSCSTTTKRTHHTTIALLLGIRVCGTVASLLARLPICLLVRRILVLRVGTLLGELLGWWLAGVLLLVVLAIARVSW